MKKIATSHYFISLPLLIQLIFFYEFFHPLILHSQTFKMNNPTELSNQWGIQFANNHASNIFINHLGSDFSSLNKFSTLVFTSSLLCNTSTLDTNSISTLRIFRQPNKNSPKVTLSQNDQWLGTDKLKHFGLSFLMTIGGYYSAKSALSLPNNDAMLPSAGATLMIGFGKEIADDFSPTNIFSLKDLFADILGILFALVVLSIIHP